MITVIPTVSYVNPREDWGTIADFPKALQRKYQQSSKYWPLKSQSILDISQKEWFKTEDLSKWVQSTSRFIKEILKHREKQEKRLGADQALLTGIGDCDEFTDIFISLSRIRGIPCRRLTGFFITQEGKSVEAHAWGEILSPRHGWVPIDIALNNLGRHSINYVILKIEEFNPALSDFQIQIQHSSTVHYRWELPDPIITPLR
jgi:transglutaminase-like putative cysteine protease